MCGGQILSKDNILLCLQVNQILCLSTGSFCYFIIWLLYMPKKSKRLVKSNTPFSITQMKNFLEELRDFFFLGCNKSKRVVKSNTRFSITEMKNFLEELRDFFFSWLQSMDIWQSKFLFWFFFFFFFTKDL